MRRGDEIGLSRLQKGGKGAIAEIAGRRFQADFFPRGLGGTVGGKEPERNPPFPADVRDKAGIRQAFFPADAVLAVDRGKKKAGFFRLALQHMQKGHRIDSARDRRADAPPREAAPIHHTHSIPHPAQFCKKIGGVAENPPPIADFIFAPFRPVREAESRTNPRAGLFSWNSPQTCAPRPPPSRRARWSPRPRRSRRDSPCPR